ncbi:MAG: DUF6340 family protein [Bacteroidota bacterium]
MRYGFLIIPTMMVLAATGCSKYGYVSLSYPIEPEVYLPDSVHSIAIVNRSLTTEEEKDAKVFEAIVSTEIGSDFLASDACIKGVYDAITQLPETELVIPTELRMHGSGTREIPDLLDWDLVAGICGKEEAQVLLVLETFDSNTDLLAKTATEQLSSILYTGKPKVTPPSEVHMQVAAYWRLYDPGTRRIVDQYQFNTSRVFPTVGGIPPPDALPLTAYDAGLAYIARYLPGSYRVKRTLYKRTGGAAKQQFKAGYRRTEVANWDGAIELWEALTEDPKRKTAGRACLNMAVANEVLGHTAPALDWAQRSYEFHKDKLGRDYAKILLRRKRIEGL